MNFDYRRNIAHNDLAVSPRSSEVFPRRSIASATLSPKDVKKPIVHMIFEEAADSEQDPYWSNELLQAARNNFSDKKTVFDGTHLSRKDNRDKVLIPSTPADAARVFVTFQQKYSKVSSGKDIERQNAIRDRVVNQVVTVEWKTASNRRRRALLFDYVARCEREQNMTADQATSLQLALTIAGNRSLLNQHTVEMSNSVILSTSCVQQKDDGFWSLTHPIEGVKKKPKSKPKKPTKIVSIDGMWDDVVRAR